MWTLEHMEGREEEHCIQNQFVAVHLKPVWRFLKKLKLEPPHDPTIQDAFTSPYTAALFTTAKTKM